MRDYLSCGDDLWAAWFDRDFASLWADPDFVELLASFGATDPASCDLDERLSDVTESLWFGSARRVLQTAIQAGQTLEAATLARFVSYSLRCDEEGQLAESFALCRSVQTTEDPELDEAMARLAARLGDEASVLVYLERVLGEREACRWEEFAPLAQARPAGFVALCERFGVDPLASLR